jgi:hypothetical protein
VCDWVRTAYTVFYRVVGADGRVVGVFVEAGLFDWKAAIIKAGDVPPVPTKLQVRGFLPMPEAPPAEVFTITPLNLRNEVVGPAKRWSKAQGLSSFFDAAEP